MAKVLHLWQSKGNKKPTLPEYLLMNFATKTSRTQILVWLIWLIALFAFVQPVSHEAAPQENTPLLGIVIHDQRNGPLFPWQPRYRWKKRALQKYRAWRQAYRRAKRVACLARLALTGMLSMAQVVDWLTASQLRYKLGALPVLYALLETLNVRHIINQHCPTRRQVEHGTVALVLILNRLMFPLPLYQVADWVGQTVLVAVLGIPAAKFNDDRLERTLDALYPHLEAIWLAVVETALLKADIDRSVIFYDLTAFIAQGQYADSEFIDFGFAHNTPSNKRKFKMSMNTAADGNIPWFYRLWSGRTADQATVQENMNNLAQWLKRRGYRPQDTLLVGDRAMLNDAIAIAYERQGLKHLTGLRCLRAEHRELLTQFPEEQFFSFPIVSGDEPHYWGRGCTVMFRHEGQTVRLKGLVVLAGPIRDQLRQARRQQLAALSQELAQVKAAIGLPRLRTVKAVQRRVNARLKSSKVGRLMSVTVRETASRQIDLDWQVDSYLLWQAEQRDGRYLLATNEWNLSHQQMFQLYRDKDGGEKRFHVCKSDLKVSPVYLHKDKRIASMLLLNMLALLAYSLLERQMRQQGLQLTTRQLIRNLEKLVIIETRCLDGSCLRRLSPVDPATAIILQLVAAALDELTQPVMPQVRPQLPPASFLCLPRRC
jgi:transposase